MILLTIKLSTRQIGEPPIPEASGRPDEVGCDARKRNAQPGLPQGFAQFGHDFGRSVVEAVKDAQQTRVHMVGGGTGGWRVQPGESKKVIALRNCEVQPLSYRRDDLLRRVRPGAALKARIVVGRHAAEQSDLLAPKPVGASSLAPGETHILRLQYLPPAAQKLRKPCSVNLHK